jgi:hypothetical protein
MNRNIQGGMVFSVENESDNIVAAIQSSGIIQHYECTLLCCNNPVCTLRDRAYEFFPSESCRPEPSNAILSSRSRCGPQETRL